MAYNFGGFDPFFWIPLGRSTSLWEHKTKQEQSVKNCKEEKAETEEKEEERKEWDYTLFFTSAHLNLKTVHWKSSLRVLTFHISAKLGTQSFTYRFWGHSRSRVLPSLAKTKRGVYKNSFNN